MINKVEETYNAMSYSIKEDVGFPDSFINLTREQERFIMDLYFADKEIVKCELLQSIEEMKEIINEI